MRLKRVAAFLLAFTMLISGISPVYADDISSNDKNYEKEVSGSDFAGGFLSDVSTGDISDNFVENHDENASEAADDHSLNVSERDISSNDVSENDGDIVEEVVEGIFEENLGENVATDYIDVPRSVLTNRAAGAVYFSKYYNQIDDVAKAVYEALYENHESFFDPETIIQVNFVDEKGKALYPDEARTTDAVRESFKNGYAAFDYDHPEIFWLNPGNFAYLKGTSKSTGLINYIKIKLSSDKTSFLQPPYDTEIADEGILMVESEIAEREAFVDYVVEKTEAVSDFSDKIEIINRELCELNYYNRYIKAGMNISAFDKRAYESVSALTEQTWLSSALDKGDYGAPVCEGYSRAFKVICDRIGITTILVPGHTSETGYAGAHMWNFVKDSFGFWYGIDTTWNDNPRSDEYINKITPESQIKKYFLVGGETVINGNTFESRHVADGPFWKNGTAFTVPELCPVTYEENSENCDFFVAVTDDENITITTDSEEFSYYNSKKLSTTVEKAVELAKANPSRKVVIQLNCDYAFADGALSALAPYSNVVISLNGHDVTFRESGAWNVNDVRIIKIPEDGYTVSLSGDLDVSGNVSDPYAKVESNGHLISVDKDMSVSLGSIKGASVIVKKGGKLSVSSLSVDELTLTEESLVIADKLECGEKAVLNKKSALVLTDGVSEINRVEIAGVNDADEYPYILITPNTDLRMGEGFVSDTEEGLLNFGVLAIEASVFPNHPDIDLNSLLLTDDNRKLFKIADPEHALDLIDYISASNNEFIFLYENETIVAKELFVHLYAVNKESGTNVFMDSFTDFEDALSYIKTVSNSKKGFKLVLTDDVKITGRFEVPSNCGSLDIIGQASFLDETGTDRHIDVSDSIRFPVDVTLKNIILTGLTLTSDKVLTLVSTKIFLSSNFTANTLDMTDSLIDAEGFVSIKSLISRTASNVILYDIDDKNYIDPEGNVGLYRDGEFSSSHESVNDAIKAITKVADPNASYEIVLYKDEAETGSGISFPKAGKAKEITVTSLGEAKKIYLNKNVKINNNVIFKNVSINSSSGINITLNKFGMTFDAVTFAPESEILNVTGSGVGKSSAINLAGASSVSVNNLKTVGSLSISGESEMIVKGDIIIGTLDMDENSSITTKKNATLSKIAKPAGTWNVYVSVSKGKVSTPVKIKGDFVNLSEGKLNIRLINKSDESIYVDNSSKVSLINAPKLTLATYKDGAVGYVVNAVDFAPDHLFKSSGYVTYMPEAMAASVVYDTEKAVPVTSVQSAFTEITKMASKREYRVVISGTDTSKITSLPTSKYANKLIIEGTGNTLVSSGTLSFTKDLTLDNVSIAHTGKLTLGNVTEKNISTISATGALAMKNVVSENTLVLKNTIASGKSRIKISGSVTSENPIYIHLFKDKAQKSYAPVGLKVDDVKYGNLVVKATGSAAASSFRLAEANLRGGCKFYSDDNFTDVFSDNAYVLSKSGSDINCVYAEKIEAALVLGDIYDGVMPVKGKGKILGLYGAINEAFVHIDELNDTSAHYSVIIFKNTKAASLKLPTNAGNVTISGGIKGSGKFSDPYYINSVNFTNNITVRCNTVFSLVQIGNKSSLNINVKSGSLEFLNLVTPRKGSSFGKVTLSEGTELILHTKDAENTYKFSSLSGTKASLTLIPGENDVTLKGSVNVGTLNVYKGEKENGVAMFDNSLKAAVINMYSGAHLTTYGTTKVTELVFDAPSQARFDGTTTLKNISSNTAAANPGEVAFARAPLNKTAMTVTGQVKGYVKFNMIAGYDPSSYRVPYTNNYYKLTDTKKLLNFKGKYNRNTLSFSLSKTRVEDHSYEEVDSTGKKTIITKYVTVYDETAIDAASYITISDSGMYYTANDEHPAAVNLTILTDTELKNDQYASYSGDMLMNFVDASKASSYINELNNPEGTYYIYLNSKANDHYIFNVTEKADAKTTARSLTLPSKGKYASLVLEGHSGGKTYVATKITGSGNVMFKNMTMIRVSGNVNIKGSLGLEWSAMAVLGKANVGSLKLNYISRMAFLGESLVGDVDGKPDGANRPAVCVLPVGKDSDKTCLKAMGSWNDFVDLKIMHYGNYKTMSSSEILSEINESSSYKISDLCKSKDGTIYALERSKMQAEIVSSEGETIGFYKSVNDAFSFINNVKDSSKEYVVYLRTGCVSDGKIYLSGNEGTISNLSLPRYAASVRITTAPGMETAELVYKTGSMKQAGSCDVIFDDVCLAETNGARALKNGKVMLDKGSVTFTILTMSYGDGVRGSEVNISSVEGTSGSIKLKSAVLNASGNINVKNIYNEGNSHILAKGKVTITNIYGSGKLYFAQFTTKAERAKSSTLLNISGNVSNTVQVGICPYEYEDAYSEPAVVSTEKIAKMLISEAESPDASIRLVNANKAAGDRFFICNEHDAPYEIQGSAVSAYKFGAGIYATISNPAVTLTGSYKDGTLFYEGHFFNLSQAVSEIERINGKKNTYIITLSKNEGEGDENGFAPVKISMPAKASLVTLKSSDEERTRAIFTDTANITLKCSMVFDGVMPVNINKTGRIKLSSYGLTIMGVTGKYMYDNKSRPGSFSAGSMEILGSKKSSLTVKLNQNFANTYIGKIASVEKVEIIGENDAVTQKINIPSGITGVTNLNICGNSDVYTGSGNVSVKNLNAQGTDEKQILLEAANLTVTGRTTLTKAYLSIGTGKVGTGKFSTKYVTIGDGDSEIDAKQDTKGNSMINVTGTVKRSSNADENAKLTLGIYYNNSSSRYAQWYSGMRIAKAPKADPSMFAVRYTKGATAGMGEEVPGYILKKTGNYLVIGMQ